MTPAARARGGSLTKGTRRRPLRHHLQASRVPDGKEMPADGLGAVNESTVSHVLRIGAPSLCSGATRTLYAPGAAHHVCLLQSARKLCKQQFPVAAGLSHGTSVRGDGGQAHPPPGRIVLLGPRLVHPLLRTRRLGVTAGRYLRAAGLRRWWRRRRRLSLPGALHRSFVESALLLLILWACSSTCGGLASSARLVAGRPVPPT